jgi:hypothetical protein
VDTAKLKVSHTTADEAIEAKTRWFRSLSLPERIALLCEYTDLALSLNPGLQEKGIAQSPNRRLLSLPRE